MTAVGEHVGVCTAALVARCDLVMVCLSPPYLMGRLATRPGPWPAGRPRHHLRRQRARTCRSQRTVVVVFDVADVAMAAHRREKSSARCRSAVCQQFCACQSSTAARSL